MSGGEYLEGLLFLGLMLGGALGGAAFMLRRGLPQLTGAPRAVAYALLATAGVLAVHLAPAALGILSRGSVAVAALLWLVAGLLVPARRAERSPPPEPLAPTDRVSWALAALGAGAVVCLLVTVAIDQLEEATVQIDALNFHLPGVARWIQTGSIWQIDVFLPGVSPGHYPNNGDVLLLATILPWRNDFLAHATMYVFWPLTGLAVYALARELRAAPALSVLVACVANSVPAVGVPALAGGVTDAPALFPFAAGVLFLVRHHRTGARSELVLAGLGLGIAFGTKWYAVSAVAVVVGVWAVALLIGRRRGGLALVLRHGAALVALIAVAGGVWMVRNLVESQNPVFPVEVAPLGVEIFDAPRDYVREQGGFTIAGYLDDPGVWREYILPQLRDALAAPAALLGLGAFAALVVVLVGRRRGVRSSRRPGRLLQGDGAPECGTAGAAGRGASRGEPVGAIAAALVCFALLVAVYSVTPYTAGGPEGMPALVGADARYLGPALLVAAALLGWAGTALGGRGMLAAAVVCALAIVDGLVQTVNRLSTNLSLGDALGAAVVIALVVGAAAALRRAPLGQRRVQAALAGAICLVLAGLAVAGHSLQRGFNERRYVGQDPVIASLEAETPAGSRVGLAGLWPDEVLPPPYPAHGPRLRNEVRYIGRPDDDVLREYRDPGGFRAALARGRYDYLVVGRGRPPKASPPEQRWARRAGFRAVARSERLTLMRAACGQGRRGRCP